MKLTLVFLGLAAARLDAMGSDSGNLLDPTEQSMGAGITDHADDQYNQLSKAPTPAPSGNVANSDIVMGTTAQIAEQAALDAIPTKQPTSFPTKAGSVCTSTVAWADGSTTKPVGWVGAGPGADYCNVWKCEVGQSSFTEQDFTGTFRKQQRQCSVEEHGNDYCSHTTCTFTGNPRVIQVHSDHREEVGGFHTCGFSQHTGARAAGRPGCDCICHGARRQDARGFARTMKEIFTSGARNGNRFRNRKVNNNHDETTNFNRFDRRFNSNNFYSKHDNIGNNGRRGGNTDAQRKFANVNANTDGGDGTTNGIRENVKNNGLSRTQYNQNDQRYNGQRVAHLHIDN